MHFPKTYPPPNPPQPPAVGMDQGSPQSPNGVLRQAQGATLGATRSRLQHPVRTAYYPRTAPKPPQKYPSPFLPHFALSSSGKFPTTLRFNPYFCAERGLSLRPVYFC